jgi:hypothetical protein
MYFSTMLDFFNIDSQLSEDERAVRDNPGAADAFTLPQAAVRAVGAPRQTMDLSNDVDLTQPLYMVDPSGHMTRIR